MLIALLKATEPLAVVDERSNPCVLVFTISVPVFESIAGFLPSKPNCNGTKNFLCCKAELVKVICSVTSANVDTPISEASVVPTWSSRLMVTLLPKGVEVTGIGDKYCLDISFEKSKP